MYVEERLISCRIKLPVEFLVVLFLEFSGFQRPCGSGIIDYLVLFSIDIFSVFPLLFLTESYFYREELTVLFQKLLDPVLLRKIL